MMHTTMPTDRTPPDAPAPLDFEAWYRAEHPRLVTAMAFATGDPELGRDVAAEACARTLERWNRVAAMDSPSAWTYRVAYNLVKRGGRRSRLESRLWRESPPPAAVVPDNSVELWDAVRSLPPRGRTAIALRYLAGLSEAEVAHAMGIAVGTVSASLTQSRQRLRTILADDEGDPRA